MREPTRAEIRSGLAPLPDVRPETPLGSPKPTVRVLSNGEPAPELAAAMAETRIVRDGYRELVGEFGPSPQTGWSARISLTTLNRHRRRADLEQFTRTESNQREDITMRYRRERDEAREQLDQVTADRDALVQLAAKWEAEALEASRSAAILRGHAATERQLRASEARQHARELLAELGGAQ